MKNLRHILLFFICFVLFFGVPVVYRQSACSQYIRAIQCAKEKQYDFAKVYLLKIIEQIKNPAAEEKRIRVELKSVNKLCIILWIYPIRNFYK